MQPAEGLFHLLLESLGRGRLLSRGDLAEIMLSAGVSDDIGRSVGGGRGDLAAVLGRLSDRGAVQSRAAPLSPGRGGDIPGGG